MISELLNAITKEHVTISNDIKVNLKIMYHYFIL
jgi:hypothetical protein